MLFVLRRAQGHRPGNWGPDDYDVLDGERNVGRIFLQAHGAWFWGLAAEFQLSGRKRYGTTATRKEAVGAFKQEYERWQREG